MTSQAVPETQAAQEEAPPPRQRPWGVVLIALALVAANVVVALGLSFPVIIPLLGLFLLVGMPTGLLMAKIDWRSTVPAVRLGYSLVTALLLLMAGGLVINTILPPLGLRDALGRIPVLLVGDVLVAWLLLWRRHRILWRPARPVWSARLTIQEKTVTRVGVASIVLGVLGADRLNNGAGDELSVAGLALVFVGLLLLFLWRHRLDPGTITFTLYALSLTMLLITSMRGWYTTGHDIQREFRVFELTKTNGNWNIARFRDPYNACLSITILPTMLWDVTKIHDVYVYKVFFQAMFALCPVLVYHLSRRFTTVTISLIGITYLLCFPTFSNDMPFENRQEIAFLFVVAVLLLMTEETMPVWQKRRWMAAFSIGMIVSHYSTASVFIATVVAVTLLRTALKLLRGWWEAAVRRLHLPRTHLEGKNAITAFGLLNVIIVLTGAVLWIGVFTQTGDTISSTFSSAFSSIGQAFSFNSKSSDVAYNLFSFGPATTPFPTSKRTRTRSPTTSPRRPRSSARIWTTSTSTSPTSTRSSMAARPSCCSSWCWSAWLPPCSPRTSGSG
jgi:hypothetical protein